MTLLHSTAGGQSKSVIISAPIIGLTQIIVESSFRLLMAVLVEWWFLQLFDGLSN